MQVEHFLEHSARRCPSKTALVVEGQRLSYQEIEASANRLAHSLQSKGIRRGDRVVIYLENCAEAVISIFGVLKAGAVFVVINSTAKADKVSYILNNCRATGLITDARKAESVAGMAGGLPYLLSTWVTGVHPSVPGLKTISLTTVLNQVDTSHPPGNPCIDIDLAALIYTSGSTGRPKGVMLTHLNIVSAATSITTYLENEPDDIILNVLPLSFDYGLYQALMTFQIGGTLLLEKSFAYPQLVLQSVMRERVTGLPIVPTMASLLLQTNLSRYRFPHLRYITNTAAVLPTNHIERLRACFPHVKLYSMYGLTECKRVSYLPPEQLDFRPGSVGRGMPNEEVYIVSETGERLCSGETGELVVRGSNVMKGYWEMPEETARVLRRGDHPWEVVLFTGDLFRTDGEGYLYFVGRKDDIIKTRGEKVSPKEVEEVLYAIEGVAEAAVVGTPDPVLGEAIKAVICMEPGYSITAQEVKQHCAGRLENFMVPKEVEFRKTMPKTGSGKIAKRELAVAALEGAA